MGKAFFCMAALLLSAGTIIAQSPAKEGIDDDPYESKSYFMYGLNYLSNNVYLGRKDSIVIPYYSPYIGYHLKNGLYASGMVSFTPAKNKHFDLAIFEIGYDHDFGKHITGGINLDKVFYNKDSRSVRASTKGFAGAYCQYTNDWVEPQVTFDLISNTNSTDHVTNFALDHDFVLAGKKLHIIPSVATNIGTKHYYDEYFINRLNKNDKALKLKKAVADAGKNKVMDYEFSMKATYFLLKWLFTIIPMYVIPVNPVVVTLPKQTVTEKLSNSFYVEVDICHR